MSPSQPVLTPGASSASAAYSSCFPGRFRDASALDNSEIRILSIAAHPMLQKGIGAIVGEEGISQTTAAAAGKEDIEAYRAARPDVTLLDLDLPDMSGIEVLIGIRSEFPDARVIVLATLQRDFEIRWYSKWGLMSAC